MSDMPAGTRPSQERRPRSRGRDARMAVTGVAAVLLVWFAAENTQTVTIHFWLVTAKASLITVVLVSAVLGALLGTVSSLMIRRKRRRRRG